MNAIFFKFKIVINLNDDFLSNTNTEGHDFVGSL